MALKSIRCLGHASRAGIVEHVVAPFPMTAIHAMKMKENGQDVIHEAVGAFQLVVILFGWRTGLQVEAENETFAFQGAKQNGIAGAAAGLAISERGVVTCLVEAEGHHLGAHTIDVYFFKGGLLSMLFHGDSAYLNDVQSGGIEQAAQRLQSRIDHLIAPVPNLVLYRIHCIDAVVEGSDLQPQFRVDTGQF